MWRLSAIKVLLELELKLCQLSKPCTFGALTNSLPGDRIVLGVKDKVAKACMFGEKDVDVDKAIDYLRSSEIAVQEIQDIGQGQLEDSVQFEKEKLKKMERGHLK